MSKDWTILVIFLATFIANNVSSQPISPTFSYSFCRTVRFGNYTTNSTFEENLKTALSTLQDHASSETFYNTSAGNSTDTVHGQYYCRGDVGSEFCSQCIKEASLKALNCSNSKAAIIWYEECTLRYMNESMYGVSEAHLVLSSFSRANLTDPGELSAVLNDTVNGLIQEVAYGTGSSPQKYFGTAEKTLSLFTNAYFLVQCSPDLDATQCESCLLSAFNETRTCCGEWPAVLYTLPPSCQVMYNTRGTFYFTSNAQPPPPLSFSPPPPPQSIHSPPPPTDQVTFLQPPPPPPPPSNTGGSTRSRQNMMLGIITIALVYFMLGFNP